MNKVYHISHRPPSKYWYLQLLCTGETNLWKGKLDIAGNVMLALYPLSTVCLTCDGSGYWWEVVTIGY